MFSISEEDVVLFGAGAAARFSTAFYIKGDGCMDFGFSRWVRCCACGAAGAVPCVLRFVGCGKYGALLRVGRLH